MDSGYKCYLGIAQIQDRKSRQECCYVGRECAGRGIIYFAITVLELELGVRLLERRDAKQGATLRTWLDGHVLPAFAGRVLALDTTVAQRTASLHVPDPRGDRDAIIAATALVHGMTVVTRNVADFADTGVAIFNPWAFGKQV